MLEQQMANFQVTLITSQDQLATILRQEFASNDELASMHAEDVDLRERLDGLSPVRIVDAEQQESYPELDKVMVHGQYHYQLQVQGRR